MKKLGAAIFLAWLLCSFGCSSTPSGTNDIKELLTNGASYLGQKVIVVGLAETQTGHSTEGLFRVVNTASNKNIWIHRSEEVDEPPQGEKVRVEGVLQQKEFSLIGKVFCVEATKISME
jgi:predicted metal-dependent enzyme (double-stranded beta helix superfamily)